MKKIITSLPLLAIILLVITATTTRAYGQAQDYLYLLEPDETTDMLVSQVWNQLQQNPPTNRSNFDQIIMSDTGDITIWLDNGTPRNVEDDMHISARHNYTYDNGYDFRRDQIIKPDGTPLVNATTQ